MKLKKLCQNIIMKFKLIGALIQWMVWIWKNGDEMRYEILDNRKSWDT